MVSAATGRSLRPSALKSSASLAAKKKLARSAAKRFSTPGRSTLTATSTPSLVRALWTWAMEAAATGGPNSENRLSTSAPRLKRMAARASSMPKGGSRSWSAFNSNARLGPTISGLVARN
jgi:hypothetical protein